MPEAAAQMPVRTTCPYCGVGCGVQATVGSDGQVEIAGDPAHPANRGRLCSKGSALGETLDLDQRLLQPRVEGRDVDWDTALDDVADRFRRVLDTHGPEAVALYVSGQLLTEDYYVANKFAKGGLGTGNIDTNSRLCMSSSVVWSPAVTTTSMRPISSCWWVRTRPGVIRLSTSAYAAISGSAKRGWL